MKYLIFAAAIIPMLAQTHFTEVRAPLTYGRWVPYFLLILLLLLRASMKKRLTRPVYRFDGLAAGWLVFIFGSSFYSLSPELTFQRGGTLVLMYLAVFWSAWGIVNQEGEEKVVEMVLRAGLVLFMLSWAIIPLGGGGLQENGRFQGWMENPNSIGLLAGILMPLALWRAEQRRSLKDKILALLILVSLGMSGSRSGMIAAFVGAMYIFWVARSRKFWLAVGAGFLVVLSFTVESFIPENWYQNTYIRPDTLATGSGRGEAWPVALDIIGYQPLTGHGFGTEELLFDYYGYGDSHFRESQGSYIHNAYLGLTAQVGLLGSLAFFLPLLFLAVRQFGEGLRDRQLSLKHGLHGTLFAALILCGSESWIYSIGNAFAFPFWLCLMLLIRRIVIARAIARQKAKVARYPVLAYQAGLNAAHQRQRQTRLT